MKKEKLVEITLTKTYVVKKNESNTAHDLFLYQELLSTVERESTSHQIIEKDSLLKRIKRDNLISSFNSFLTRATTTYLQNNWFPNNSIKCRSFKEIPVFFSDTEMLLDENTQELFFVLFFQSRNLCYLHTIDNEILVTPIGNLGDIFHIDFSDKSLSISFVDGLNRR